MYTYTFAVKVLLNSLKRGGLRRGKWKMCSLHFQNEGLYFVLLLYWPLTQAPESAFIFALRYSLFRENARENVTHTPLKNKKKQRKKRFLRTSGNVLFSVFLLL